MKYYITAISNLQEILLGISLLILMTLPLAILFSPEMVMPRTMALYAVVHLTVFFVMIIRPLADIFIKNRYIRPLVILRKGFGVLSASIIVSFLIAKIIINPSGYANDFFATAHWSFENNAIFAHLADITAVLLLITSNKLSKRIMGKWWKRVQRLSYVYFFASGLYVYLSFDETIVLNYMVIVLILTIVAFIKNQLRKIPSPQQA